MSRSYKSELLSEAEVEAFRAAQARGVFPSAPVPSHLGAPLHPTHRRMVLASGFELKGELELTARNVESGEVDWAIQQPNLVTDLGRSAFFFDGWSTLRLGFAPSIETPSMFRSTLSTDTTQAFMSASSLGGGTATPATYTRQWSTTFTAPGSNRTLGTIWVSAGSGSTVFDATIGPATIWAYSLLTPPKTQTTTQSLEVVYKLSMNPIF